MQMAVADVELLMQIIGELGFIGYKVSLCKLKGYSLQQCANKYGLTKEQARYSWKKCEDLEYDKALARLFGIQYM